jgi:hypothetical protein
MKVTNKQTTSVDRRTVTDGGINTQMSGGGFELDTIYASNTNRQTTSTEYTGDAQGEQEGGYKNSSVYAPNTMRQTVAVDYTGGAGNVDSKPMSYSDIYNSTVRTLREEIDQERQPSGSGSKVGTNRSQVNMTTNRTGDMENTHLNERGITATKIYNSIPQPMLVGVTKDKETVPNEPIQNRLDSAILDAFRSNPYTQSLHSYAFP